MNGLDAIIGKILTDAREQADGIRDKARQEAEEIVRDGERDAAAVSRTMEASAEEEVETVQSRAESSASLASRRILLEARQQRVTELVQRTLAALPDLPDERKVALYAEGLSVARGGETVVFAERDLISGVARRAVDRVLEEKQLTDGLTIRETPGDFSGGLILQRGRIEENLTFEMLVQQSREELETITSRMLEEQE